MAQSPKNESKPLGLIWISCPPSVVTAGLVRALEEQARVHIGMVPPEEVPSCVVLCSNGQRETLGYVVEGLSNAEIGKRLFLSESTVKQHLRSAYKLLAVNNRTEAANLFRRSTKES